MERTHDYVIVCNSYKGKNSQMKVVEDFESRPPKAVSFFLSRETMRYRNGMSRSCRRCCLVTVEEGCQEETLKKLENEERRIRSEIAQKVIEGITRKASMHENAESTTQRTVGQNVNRNRKRRRGGSEGMPHGGPDGSVVG